MKIYCDKKLSKETLMIIESSLHAVDPYQILKNCIHYNHKQIIVGSQMISVDNLGALHLIGFGKAVLPMAKAAVEQLNGRITEGVLVSKHFNFLDAYEFPQSIQIMIGDHPTPTERSVEAAQALINLLKITKENDLVIGLISGGASSLVTMPKIPLNINQLNQLTAALLRSGANIYEMNTVRKHLDDIKGGGLLRFIYPAFSFNLILSDVIGDDLSVIASGPTCSDPTTYKEALDIIKKYNLLEELDRKILDVLQKGIRGEIEETVKENDPLLKKTHNEIIGSLTSAAMQAKQKAEELGFQVEIYSLCVKGEAKEVGKTLARYLKERCREIPITKKPLCIIAGGETTVTVAGKGKGGRNLELALAAAMELDECENLKFITLATDGEDGPTDAAGAVVDGGTLAQAKGFGLNALDYLCDNNSYEFFDKVGGLIKTGPTGTNVNDLVFMFAYP